MHSSLSSRASRHANVTPILLSTPNWYELNVEQAETESNNLKEMIFELGFKGETEVKEGRSRRKHRIWLIKGFSEFQIQLQPLFICKHSEEITTSEFFSNVLQTH